MGGRGGATLGHVSITLTIMLCALPRCGHTPAPVCLKILGSPQGGAYSERLAGSKINLRIAFWPAIFLVYESITEVGVAVLGITLEFRQIVEAHQSRVFSIAYRVLGDRGTAEEVAQDVFLELVPGVRRHRVR